MRKRIKANRRTLKAMCHLSDLVRNPVTTLRPHKKRHLPTPMKEVQTLRQLKTINWNSTHTTMLEKLNRLRTIRFTLHLMKSALPAQGEALSDCTELSQQGISMTDTAHKARLFEFSF